MVASKHWKNPPWFESDSSFGPCYVTCSSWWSRCKVSGSLPSWVLLGTGPSDRCTRPGKREQKTKLERSTMLFSWVNPLFLWPFSIAMFYQRVFLSWGKNVSWSEQVFDRNTFLPKNASENPTENKTFSNLLCVETSIPEVLVLRRCSFDCPNPEESKLCRDGSIAWAHMDRIKTNRSIPEVLHLPPVGPWQSVVFLPFELLVHPFSQWIGLRENLQESPMIFMGKSMVSGFDFRFNQSIDFYRFSCFWSSLFPLE